MSWDIEPAEEVEAWLQDLDDDSYDLVTAALDKLSNDGPTLGRPLVDRIQGSHLHNLKELRPGSAGSTELRILFIFDPQRRAVLLVAGDKTGQWKSWYRTAIPLAEQRYERWTTAPR